MKKRTKKLLIYFIVLLIIALDYPYIEKYVENSLENYELGVVERVIDGDTLQVNRTSVRLLGINTPEKKEAYYSEAKEFLSNKTQGQLVKLVKGKDDVDLYRRKLRYIYLGDQNINLKIIEKGYANYYFPQGKDKYYAEFKKAWTQCMTNNINLCEKSSDECASCIELKEFDSTKEVIVLSNKCDFTCNLTGWTIKDEGRKVFTFPNFTLENEVRIKVGSEKDTKDELFWKGEDYVWTKTGDSLFLRDNKHELVLFHSY